MVILGIDWGKVFSIPFWLEVDPGVLSVRFERIFLFVLFVSYLVYFLSKFWQKRLVARRNFIKANFLNKTATFCLTMAVSFSFIFFFRYEAIPILGGRFWIFIWILMGLVWVILLIRHYFMIMPKQMEELAAKKKRSKYLNFSKKKK
jgi:hypothetical protein